MFKLLREIRIYTIHKLKETRGDIGQMFTPPKSKSPWEAMTAGSTGGWAGFAGPSQTVNPKDAPGWGWVGPVATAAAGAIPFVGPALSAGMGAMGSMGGGTGFQGTDYGWGRNIGSTLAGAGMGYLAGGVGRGISAGVGQALAGGTTSAGSGAIGNLFVEGFGKGFGSYGLQSAGAKSFMSGKTAAGAGGSTSLSPTQTAQLQKIVSSPGQYDPSTVSRAQELLSTNVAAAGGGGAAGVAGGAGAGAGASGGFNVGQLVGPALAAGGAIGSMAGKPPEFDYQNTQQRLEATRGVLSKYLGESAAELPEAAASEYLRQIKTPLGELYPVERDARWGRVQPLIDKSYDEYDASIKQQFAQAGGSGSSDERKALDESRSLRTAELTQARAEVESEVFKTQVLIKQDALARAAQQGRFDMEIATELAAIMGKDQELMMAMESNNYETFQQLMSQIFQLGGQISLESFTPRMQM